MRSIFLLLLFINCFSASGQIHLDNPSFDGEPQDATIPTGWHPCKLGSTPDILPGPWGVYTEPSDGATFLGLITRDDGTWESIGQQLKKPMLANECYSFSIDLAYSTGYAGYNLPLKFRVWGGKDQCAEDQLLAETDFVQHTDWKRYQLDFITKYDINYIILEAFVADGIFFTYKGNILLDDISPIIRCKRASISINPPQNRG